MPPEALLHKLKNLDKLAHTYGIECIERQILAEADIGHSD